ncbi:putative transcription factor C2H2 family [Helianthus anomalus]
MDYVDMIAIEDQQDEEEHEEEEEEEESEEAEWIPSSSRVSGNDKKSSKEVVVCGDDDFNLDIEGLCCPICTEPWTTGGLHQISCLPCGHIYGLSCIKKWIQQRSRSAKCPQCNKKCTRKDVRVLYAEQLHVVDAEVQKQVQSLEAKCALLEQKNAICCKKEVEAQKREADLHLKVAKLTEKTKYLERLLKDRQREPFASNLGYQRRVINGNGSGSVFCSGAFTLQREFQVDGGRYFDIDASGQLMIVARRQNGTGGTSILSKISLLAPNEREDIHLPAYTKAVRALCVRPCTRQALVASLGKKLSIVSTESNNTVVTYDLPASAWSCSWDVDNPYYVYTGLQNGMVMSFDTRQTKAPLETRIGLSCNPVHTLISVAPDSSSGTTTLLSASQIGICEWNIGSSEERPYLIPESKNEGQVCISLAHSGGDDIVASFRPKIETSTQITVSQSPSISCGVEGCHVVYKRGGAHSYQKTGSLVAEVDSIRLPKCSIINKPNHSPMFVAANEVTSDLVLHDLSKLAVVQRLKTPKNQISDVKCAQIWNSSVMGCLSGDVVQLFTSP